MANLICQFEGVRGREMELYDNKVVITTKKTVGSLITGNITDGEKTVFLKDVVGIQFKESGALIGYLQFETPSMQMNNNNNNMFSENTFTYENAKNGITNELMRAVYKYVTDRIEDLKYGTAIAGDAPNFEAMKQVATPPPAQTGYAAPPAAPQTFMCPKCGAQIAYGAPACGGCGQTFDWTQTQ